MSQPLSELQQILQLLIAEYGKLQQQMETQRAAMTLFDLKAIEQMTLQQEATRRRVASLEEKRRLVMIQLARALRLQGQPTLKQLADAYGPQGSALLKLREELKAVITELSRQTFIAGRLAGAVVGHLNTAMRILAGAMGRAGVYTRRGVPRLASRVGGMEAVG